MKEMRTKYRDVEQTAVLRIRNIKFSSSHSHAFISDAKARSRKDLKSVPISWAFLREASGMPNTSSQRKRVDLLHLCNTLACAAGLPGNGKTLMSAHQQACCFTIRYSHRWTEVRGDLSSAIAPVCCENRLFLQCFFADTHVPCPQFLCAKALFVARC